jgi:hypothetical protein
MEYFHVHICLASPLTQGIFVTRRKRHDVNALFLVAATAGLYCVLDTVLYSSPFSF